MLGEGGSPTLSPGTDAGRVCPKALHDAEPTKHTQPFTEGKGFGDRDLEQALFCKNRIFYKLTAPDGIFGGNFLQRHLIIMHIEAMMRIAGKIGIEI